MTATTKIDANRVRELFDYDPDTGSFGWSHHPDVFQHRRGMVAGYFESTTGYMRVGLNQKNHYVHRLVWLHFYGEMPVNDIDHINGDRTDNRITNLRDVPRRVNLQNRRRVLSETGYLGVTRKESGMYAAQITVDRKNYYLGRFGTAEEAHAAYLAAKRKLHEGCVV